MPSATRTCVFCGSEGKLEQEHIIPAWVGRLLPDLGHGTHERIGTVGTEPVAWRGKAYTRTARVVCRTCNGGWMSDIEDRTKPLLRPIILGQRRTLQPGALKRIALWAFTRALIGATRFPDMPREPYALLYGKRRMPPRAKVWLGAFAPGPHMTYHTIVPLQVHRPHTEGQSGNAHMTTFSVGHGLFHVFGNYSGKPSAHNFTGQLARAWFQIWPAHNAVQWPPALSLDEAALDAITETYGPPLAPPARAS